MGILIRLLVSGFAVFITARILPGVSVDSFITALLVAVVMGVVNALIKPILVIITLPINLVTLGLFTFVINGVLVLLVSSVINGFKVENFLWAILFSIVLTFVGGILDAIIK